MLKFRSIKTEKQLFTHNVILNLFGQCAPMVAAFFAIPILIKSLGTDRFGILTLAWVFVGYFSLFDMGLGRALTKFVAEYIGKNQKNKIPQLIWTALSMMAALGIAGAIFIMLLTPRLIEKYLNIPEVLQTETRFSFYLLAASIPIVIIITGLRGVLESHQRFDFVNAIRVPMGFFTFLGPLIVLPFSKSLVSLVSVLVFGRIIACFFHIILCYQIVPTLFVNMHLEKSIAKQMLNFGGWLTVSNIVGPIMLYADRFFIASMISVSDVAFYTTPYEIIIKLLIIPSAILGVMFPAFASSFENNTAHLKHLYFQTIKNLSIIIVPVALFVFYFSEKGLELWINADFASHSFRVAQILLLGVFINSFGHISQSLIQASGRPDITAKLHLFEVPFYLIYLWILLSKYGIEGAALAWLIRVTLSTIILSLLANLMIKIKMSQL
jgi:O-antigen/teichoic acid export membrane protein